MKLTIRDLFNNYIVLIILSIPFLEPRCLYDMEAMSFVHNLFILWRFYTAIGIIVLGLLCIKKISGYCWAMIAFQVIYILATYMNNTGNASYIMRLQITVIGFCILVDLALQFSSIKIINIFAMALTLLTIANFATLFLYPEGMYVSNSLNGNWKSNWLFGFKNVFIFSILPMLFFVAIRLLLTKKKLDWSFWLMLAISAYSIFRVGSITSGFCILMMAILIILFERRDFTLILNARNYMYVSLGLSWSLVTASLIPMLSKYLSVINRDISTMSNRTFIWQRAVMCVGKSLFSGYGRETEYSVYTNLGAYHAHNQWLDVLYIGGIIAFALLLVLFLYAIRINSKSPNIRLQNAINSILLGYFILYITEARRDDLYIYVILIVISHIRELAEKCARNPIKTRREKYVIRIR